jgi:O-antigen biosynthesis protein WbqV
MTIPEAVQLVLQASAVASEDHTQHLRRFVLEMGEPVRILDLAHQMIELAGLEVGTDIEVCFTGLKPGEKLREELVDTDESATLALPGVSEITSPAADLEVGKMLSRLMELARTGQELALRHTVEECVARARGGQSEPVLAADEPREWFPAPQYADAANGWNTAGAMRAGRNVG